MNEVLHRLVGVGMPVRAGCLVGLQGGEGFAQGRVQLRGHKDVRLGNVEDGIQGRSNVCALKVFGFVAEFENHLEVEGGYERGG